MSTHGQWAFVFLDHTRFSPIIELMETTDHYCWLQLSIQMRDGISSRAACWVCNAVAQLFLSSVYSKEIMTIAVSTVCSSFRLQSPRVCAGIVDSFKVSLSTFNTISLLANNHDHFDRVLNQWPEAPLVKGCQKYRVRSERCSDIGQVHAQH